MPFDTSQPAYVAYRSVVAERTRPLLAWVGAGLSRSAGLPSWADLRGNLIEAGETKSKSLDAASEKALASKLAVASREENFWVSFELLKNALGTTTFRDTIRAALTPADTAGVPETYSQLWRLGIKGLLNLNLDRLATRAAGDAFPTTQVIEKSGREIVHLSYLLGGGQRFVANLHGTIEDMGSWIMTLSDLKAARDEPAHAAFLTSCLSTHTVLFVGIGADDLAVGGHLEWLASNAVELPTHYWLTDRRDGDTDGWAEKAGVRVIRYEAQSGDHAQLDEFFADLHSFLPSESDDKPPPAYIAASGASVKEPSELPEPADLLALDAEAIRKHLNAAAGAILSDESPSGYDRYKEFAGKYGQAIYRAWYTSTTPGENVLLGYTLEREIAKGAFGRVYRATGPGNETVAVKVLREDIRSNDELLRSFRRGVRSMKILQQRQTDGMVAYVQASEIPAFVVMDWIEGPNLSDAKSARALDDWPAILSVGSQLAAIVKRAHGLPERVLHRDLRPSNAMLRDFWTTGEVSDVVVLDFDLSWHRGAYEQSVLHTTSTGYLAPEQVSTRSGVSTRSAAVDSFGLGMTLFFLCSGEEPLPNDHRRPDWETRLRTECARIATTTWQSVGARVSRLIHQATRDVQAERVDMAEIGRELDRLLAAAVAPEEVGDVELLAEELAARCEAFDGYYWDADRLEAVRESPTGLTLRVRADVSRQTIAVDISWVQTGFEEVRRLGKYVTPGARVALEQLQSSGFQITEQSIQPSAVRIVAELRAGQLVDELDATSAAIARATGRLRFGEHTRD